VEGVPETGAEAVVASVVAWVVAAVVAWVVTAVVAWVVAAVVACVVAAVVVVVLNSTFLDCEIDSMKRTCFRSFGLTCLPIRSSYAAIAIADVTRVPAHDFTTEFGAH